MGKNPARDGSAVLTAVIPKFRGELVALFWECRVIRFNMLKLWSLTFILLCSIHPSLLADDYSHIQGVGNNVRIDELSFSNILKWDLKYLSYTKRQTRYLAPDWKNKFALPVLPANSSARTKAELGYLMKLLPEGDDYKNSSKLIGCIKS